MVATIHLDQIIHLLQGSEPHGCGHLGHLAVGADIGDIVVTGKAEILQVIDALLGFFIGANDGTALEGIENLGGVKTQDG